MTPEQMYVELLKKTLSCMLWDEPGVTEDQKFYGRIWPTMAHTMIGQRRLENIQVCVQKIIEENIPGDLIETGVWRGGACIFMKGLLDVLKQNRKIYVADSFKGLPNPKPEYPHDSGDKHHTYAQLAVSKQQVEENFRKYGLLDDQVIFVEGWFNETMPTLTGVVFSLIRLDGDMYESTIVVLNNLYPKLSIGGFCIIDDYALIGARTAVIDYRKEHNITDEIIKIDDTGVYWKKTS